MSIPIWSGIGAHASRYDAWLCDIWGVLHNGAAAFHGVAEACTQYRRGGGRVLLISNAPRPSSAVGPQLDKLGISRDAYDAILTSGDLTRDILSRVTSRQRILHIGPERDLGLFAGLDAALVDEADADVVVCTGLFDDTTETPASYRAQFDRLKARNLPMICANPDITVERGGQIIYCAGALAEAYHALGGDVQWFGKPYRAAYEAAQAEVARVAGRTIEPSRLLAIGDGVYTDIKGAAAFGIDSLYVASPIYLKEPFSADSVSRLFAPLGYAPQAAMPRLAW
jgi:HAD superfamily hydrolase (TIGR01459 family)